ncbi:MAG: outer membrane beta-barrel protein [Saprospiraceae bacterium]|nr:outer membrane beta-barrel protein [Saprospiraceae bacterium]
MKIIKFVFFLVFIKITVDPEVLIAQSNAVLLNISINSYKLDRFNLPDLNSAIIQGTGFNLGIGYEKMMFKKTSILLGFEFSKRKYDYAIGPRNNNFNDNYISFPLSLNYYIIKKLAIQLGLQFDHLVFKQKFIYYKDAPNDQISGYTKYDIGLNSGIRIQLHRFEINGSFNYGLRNIYCLTYLDPVSGELLDDFAKSHMFKFGISYLLK